MSSHKDNSTLSSAYKRLSRIESEHCSLFCKLAGMPKPADLLEPAGGLQGTEGAEDRVEEEQEDQGTIVVEVELAIAGLVALTAHVMEPVEERE